MIVGVDEVGRGCLAGPVVAAAVILDQKQSIDHLTDSKQLSVKQRTELFECIVQHALVYSVGYASVEEIDRLNILHASLLAMRRAVLGLSSAAIEAVWVDGNCCPPGLPYPTQAIVKGDTFVDCISAASVVAKVIRDRLMQSLDSQYPRYGFAKHKGYPTVLHKAALKQFGPCRGIHRASFKGVFFGK